MLLLYNLFIRLYYLVVCLVSLWNKKAKAWIDGRKGWDKTLSQKITKADNFIWMHCSSAGEFEQGKPLIEALKKQYPHHKVLVSFFSPSGYAVAKNYELADVITYLPLDTKKNAEQFLSIVNLQLAIFVKYEFWYHHLSIAHSRRIPLLLVSAVFRKEQIFFTPYGRFFQNMLRFFQQIFVQDEASLQLLNEKGFANVTISGDTRFDRVKKISRNAEPISLIEDFIRGKKAIVAGSTWSEDEELLKAFITSSNIKLILAPHEVNESHLQQLQNLFPAALMYSSLKSKKSLNQSPVLIIDSVGLLSRLYQHATITYIGGGFTKDGIHNILEAAVWGKPVIFGPNYKKYREASELIAAGGGFSVNNAVELKGIAIDLFDDTALLKTSSGNAKAYVERNTGATQKIMQAIQENRLLTKP